MVLKNNTFFKDNNHAYERPTDCRLGGNMDWMYRGDKPNTEEYLMGKPVDKQITGEPSANDDDGLLS